MNSKNSKIAVVGASGLVGSALMSEFGSRYSTVGTFCQKSIPNLIHLDLRDRDQVRSVLLRICPDVILCSAAEPNVELCETDPAGTHRINVEGVRNLVAVTAEVGAALVYFSSEYVFDGVSSGPYSESDTCNPLNEYGRQKLDCERMIAAQMERYVIARVSGVYNWEVSKKNFVVRFIDALSEGRSFRVPFDQIITPTYAPNLAQCVRSLVENEHWGLMHLSGSCPMPRTEFAQLIANVFGLDGSLVIPTATSDLHLLALRPRAAGLSVAKAQALLDFTIFGVREGLEMMKRERPRQFWKRSLTAI